MWQGKKWVSLKLVEGDSSFPTKLKRASVFASNNRPLFLAYKDIEWLDAGSGLQDTIPNSLLQIDLQNVGSFPSSI